MELREKHCWVEIDIDAIKHNYELIKYTLNKPFYTVVKADAYGHGAKYLSKVYSQLDTFGFAVSCFSEAMELRNAGITKPVLIMGYTEPNKAYELFKNNLTQTVFSLEYAKALNDQALYPVECHIKLDTGMTRVGFQTDEVNFGQSMTDIIEVSKMENLKITGIFTHHAVADSYTGDHPDFTKMQFERFDRMVTALEGMGVKLGLRHCANSATTIAYAERHIDMCRSGIITYGLLPSGENAGMIDLKPLMTVKTTVGLVKHVPAGSQVSYGRTYTAETERVLATVPIGYADGYNRALSSKANMIVNGHYAPVVGRVCMDQLMIDVTGIPNVKMGTEVIVVGTDGDKHVTFDDLAAILGTINYELPCVITKRVPRIYKENGEIVGIVDHVLHQYK